MLAASMSSITALAVLSSSAALAVFHLLLLMLKLFCVLSHARARARAHTHTHCKHRECAGGYGHRHKRQRGLHYRCPHLRTHARTLYDKNMYMCTHVCVCVCVCVRINPSTRRPLRESVRARRARLHSVCLFFKCVCLHHKASESSCVVP